MQHKPSNQSSAPCSTNRPIRAQLHTARTVQSELSYTQQEPSNQSSATHSRNLRCPSLRFLVLVKVQTHHVPRYRLLVVSCSVSYFLFDGFFSIQIVIGWFSLTSQVQTSEAHPISGSCLRPSRCCLQTLSLFPLNERETSGFLSVSHTHTLTLCSLIGCCLIPAPAHSLSQPIEREQCGSPPTHSESQNTELHSVITLV